MEQGKGFSLGKIEWVLEAVKELTTREQEEGTRAERECVQEVAEPAALVGVKAIAGGQFHSLALTEERDVYAWGRNWFGALGLGEEEERLTPTKVPGLEGVKAIACGYIHSLALTASGKVYRWGLHSSDSDEAILNRPSKVPGLDGIVAVIGESWCSFALTESGDVYAWADNKYWQLGLGDTECRLVPTKVPGLTGVKAIAGGSFRGGPHHYLALTQSGEVYAWGSNDKGQLI